ncbi:MAG: heavy metal translocating P-type ATPase [Desulfobacteraceae bacterium]|jgi:heavy metal translocating P-type ATPase|nr:heavy metal translocating P-type ATPase [Desulfobacteraceae bacterium]
MPEQKPKLSGTPSSQAVCDLCGLSLRHGRFSATFSGKTYHFCCNGCRQVFNILLEASDGGSPEEFRQSELFKQCREKGIIPKSEAELAHNQPDGESRISPGKEPAPPATSSTADHQSENVLDLVLKIGNMWCPACAWLIDESLQKSAGVIDSDCNFTTDRLQIRYDPVHTSPTQIIQTIARLGYKAAAPDDPVHAAERRKEFVRFAISAFLTMNIMMLSWALYSGFVTEFSLDTIYKLSWPAFFMATIVLVYGGFSFFKKAWSGLTNAAFSMETLIVIGSLSAYGYSTVSLLAGSIHLYYDTSAMLITLVLLGKSLESRAKGRVLEGLENFLSLKPTKVRICTDQYPEGRFVAAEQLEPGDTVRVNENEIVAADGRISSGAGLVDESSLTGEPLPVDKKPGDNLRSGTRIIKGAIFYKAEKTGSDSTLGQMMDIIEKTLLAKTPLEGKTDVILQWFVPTILVLAAGTGLVCFYAGLSTEEAMLRAVTVMVISCPCALGIAIPLARVAGISIAGQKGILVRDFSAFERAARIDTFVFDKTGTITEGKWTLKEVIPIAEITPGQALALVAGLEKESEHFIGLEILRYASENNIQPEAVENIRMEEKGLMGQSSSGEVKFGSAEYLARELEKDASGPLKTVIGEQPQHSFVFLGLAGQLAAVFVFGDRLRADVPSVIGELQGRGYRLALVSGDGDRTTKAIGEEVGIRHSYGGKFPRDKADTIAELQKQGQQVAMVGDGINDAPALVQADLSMAVHSGGQLSKEAADITLMGAEPQQIIEFLDFAGQVNKKISQNLGLTFLYNAISIPIAMSGLLNPLVAVSAMLLSSLSVTGNTLLLVRKNS